MSSGSLSISICEDWEPLSSSEPSSRLLFNDFYLVRLLRRVLALVRDSFVPLAAFDRDTLILLGFSSVGKMPK